MKDSLFEMLLHLFEKTLAQLKKSNTSSSSDGVEGAELQEETSDSSPKLAVIKPAQLNSMRVFTRDEQQKLTKASYQFLMRLASWGVITADVLELILNRLIFSESRFVTLQETKWTIRNTLADTLNAEQLAFLDLVLYHKEDQLPLH